NVLFVYVIWTSYDEWYLVFSYFMDLIWWYLINKFIYIYIYIYKPQPAFRFTTGPVVGKRLEASLLFFVVL
ncbi:hypothetical protein ACMBCM_10095, partial [Spiroplasma sp. K1]